MFVEERDEVKFETNRGRDAFVEKIIEICDDYSVRFVDEDVSCFPRRRNHGEK